MLYTVLTASTIHGRMCPGSSSSQAAPVSGPSENATQVHASKNKVDPAKAYELGSAFTWLNGEKETAPALAEHCGQHPSLLRGAGHPLPMPMPGPCCGCRSQLWGRAPGTTGVSHPDPRGHCTEQKSLVFAKLHARINSCGNYSNKSISKPDLLILGWGHFFI